LRVPKNFDSALPFSDKLALSLLKTELATGRVRVAAATGPDWQYHVPLNCFNGSAHMFLSFL
jgi:hypothetical protein